MGGTRPVVGGRMVSLVGRGNWSFSNWGSWCKMMVCRVYDSIFGGFMTKCAVLEFWYLYYFVKTILIFQNKKFRFVNLNLFQIQNKSTNYFSTKIINLFSISRNLSASCGRVSSWCASTRQGSGARHCGEKNGTTTVGE